MKKNFKNRIKNYLANKLNPISPGEKKSYSQCGEDIIIEFVLNRFGISKPTYLDIGAHHPTYLNNTFLFYKKGCKGVNIEPDPYLFREFVKERSQDVNLNLGIGFNGDIPQKADFYIMNERVFNTFSKEEATRIHETTQYKIKEVVAVDIVSVNKILNDYFKDNKPDIVSIDVEGWDLPIVKSMDLSQFKKTIFCVETINFTEDNNEQKQQDIIDHFLANGFFLYADTYINSIFVKKGSWQ